jgi:type I restriction enzyme M protein
MQGAVDRRRSIPDDIFLSIKIPIPSKPVQKSIANKYLLIERNKISIKKTEKTVQKNIEFLWK